MEQVSGENYTVGNHFSSQTNEAYSWHYNSNQVHHLQRINGQGECEIVYVGDCLQLSAAPANYIADWRAVMDVDILCNKVPGGKLKRLAWTNGIGGIGMIDVEASIATDFFTTPFFDICGDPCAYISLCVPEVDGCINGEWVPFIDADKGLNNMMLDRAMKFAIRQVYYDGRANEISDWSTPYYQDSKGCFDSNEGYPRCIKFRIPLGNPLVEKIEFYASEDGGVTWYLRDTIEKYKEYNSTQQYWYQRSLTEAISETYSDSDCSFDYIFCNDTQKLAVDPVLFTRVSNPIPRDAQGLVRIKDTIAAYNYVSGTCPIGRNELDKIQLDMDCASEANCDSELVNVTVRAVIYADVLYDSSIGGNGYIFRAGGGYGAPDDEDDTAWFGTGGQFLRQNFEPKSKVRNFIPYIEGTNYWGVMEQWRSAPNFTSRKKVGVLSGLSDDSTRKWLTNDVTSGNFYYQEYIFKVPKGMKGIIRLASHHEVNGNIQNQNTSTQVSGMIGVNGLKSYTGNTQLDHTDNIVKEMSFDTCNGDVDNFDAFVVNDVTFSDETGYSGYIKDKNGLPVHGARIYAGSTFRRTTDYNGFFFFHDPDNLVVHNVAVEQSCIGDFTNIANFTVTSDTATHQMSEIDYEIDSDFYKDNFLATINIPVKDCDGNPVRGVRVALSGAKNKVTDVDGIARFKIRNYNSRNRSVVAYVMDKGNCFTLDCNNQCNPCMPSTISLTLATCFQANPTYTITPTSQLNVSNLIGNRRTLKRGGEYDFAAVVEGDCGMVSAAYPLRSISIPKVQETGGFGVCIFTVNFNNIVLPSWGKRIKIVRSANKNPFTLQWVVDSIDRTADGKIVLTIQSLNDYNTRYNFKTNTVYKFAIGDRIEFIKNGDGKIFDTATYGNLNYRVLSPFNDEVISGVTDDVNYFNQIQIIDDNKLDGLTEGAIIQINPASVSTEQVTYFEFCANFSVTNGAVEIQTGTFETFDTFLVSRQIGSFPPMYFEHKSPSDFWGETVVGGLSEFLSDIGKPHFLNPYENESRQIRSFSINSSTQLNYFGDLVRRLNAENQGAITAVFIVDDSVGLAICENDNFLFQIADDLLRVGSDGIIRAASADSIISNPQAKVAGAYGCQYQDIGSVLFYDNFAMFFDGRVDSYIIHNFSYAKIAGSYINEGEIITSCNSYFRKRNRAKENFNKTSTDFLDHYRFSTGINKSNNVVYLTIKSLRHAGIMNEKAPYIAPNETIAYNPANDSFLTFCGFTPESYSLLTLDTDSGCAFLTYQNSQPFVHMVNPDRWDEFYGQSTDWHIGITINKFTDKQKIGVSIEEQTGHFFYVPKVTTDKVGFVSEIPPIKWKRNGDKFNAAFLNNINSRGGLYGNENCRGYVINVLFTRNNTLNLAYNTIDDALRTAYSEVDSFLFKFQIQEQSGFTENL